MESDALKKIERSSRRSAILTLVGVCIFLGSLLYSSYSLHKTDNELTTANNKIDSIQLKNDSLNLNLKKLSLHIINLKNDEKDLTDFLIRLIRTTSENKAISDYGFIDWERITKSIVNLPSGKRKSAVLIALLLTWKEMPFELGSKSPSVGFDSPSFLAYVIGQAGIVVRRNPNEIMSQSLMANFKKVDKPLPGDLIFYKGNVGSFGLMYICEGQENGQGIAVGTLQKQHPLTLYETIFVIRKYFPFIGYYRVNYEDYDSNKSNNK